MGSDTMDLAQLASLLQRDQRELSKLANRGELPGRKVGGEWRFANAEIQQWLESELPGLNEAQLKSLEEAHPEPTEPLVTLLLAPDCVEVPLQVPNVLPSGENATHRTYSVWPRSVIFSFPVFTSHSLAV